MQLKGQNVNIPDTNFKSFLVQASVNNQSAKDLNGNYFKIDANNDGEIQETEALQVSALQMIVANINSVVGITSFLNIKELRCSTNGLMSLDLQGLTKLEELYCSQNQLTTLDLQGLENLKYVYCAYNNLTSLNVQGLSNLIWVECPMNNLTTLDLHSLPNLENVSCFTNNLTILNLQNSPKINFVHCSDNQLSNLEINHLSNLKTLSCFGNNLANLNVANLAKLEFLEFSQNNISTIDFTGLINLKNLQFFDNHISTLNLQGLLALQTLSCGWNNLTTLNVSNNPNLTSVDFRNNQITSVFLKNGSNQLVQLSGNPQLGYICADQSEVTQLQNLVSQNGYITQIDTNCELSLSSNEIKGNSNKIELYPNPVQDVLNIKTNEKIERIDIYDMSGRRINSTINLQNRIDLKDLKSGDYIIEIMTDKNKYQDKIIKK